MLEKVLDEVTEVIAGELRRRIKDYTYSPMIPLLQAAIDVKAESDRALMVRLGCEAVDGNWHSVIPAMVALELFDISLIVIDDFFDEQTRRMGRPTVFAKWGPLHAVATGVVLKSMATRALIESCKSGNSGEQNLGLILSLFEQTHECIYYGQYQDITYTDIDLRKTSEQMYLDMVRHTTGAEIAAAVQIGGILVNGSPRRIAALKEFGISVGTIFQIRDDLIDYVNVEELIGKMPFTDIQQRRRRLPLILAYHLSEPEETELIHKVATKPKLDEKDIHFIQDLVSTQEVLERTKEIVGGLRLDAENALSRLKDSIAKEVLGDVLELACDI